MSTQANHEFCHRCGEYVDFAVTGGRSECLDCALLEFTEWLERHPHASHVEIDQCSAMHQLSRRQARYVRRLVNQARLAASA